MRIISMIGTGNMARAIGTLAVAGGMSGSGAVEAPGEIGIVWPGDGAYRVHAGPSSTWLTWRCCMVACRVSIGGDSIRRPARWPDHSKRPDYSGNTTRVDTMTWPFLQQCSKSSLASPMSITVTTPITR